MTAKTAEMDSEMMEKILKRGWPALGGLVLLALVGTPPGVAADEPAAEKPAVPKSIEVRPAEVDLVGRREVARLSVLGRQDAGRVTDLSRVNVIRSRSGLYPRRLNRNPFFPWGDP